MKKMIKILGIMISYMAGILTWHLIARYLGVISLLDIVWQLLGM